MSTALVPVENLEEVEALDPATREIAVTRMLTEARTWLAHAVESTGPTEIAQFKAMVATVAETTKQLNLSKEIQLDAQEMVRRAERGLGQAIRRGQEAGEIRSREDTYGTGVVQGDSEKLAPTDLATKSELYGSGLRPGIYEMADNVSDEQFEQAITEAKGEGNLSRANVVRKATGKNKSVPTGRPDILRKHRHLDSNRIVGQTVQGAAPVQDLIDLVDWASLDRDLIPEWISSLRLSITRLRTLQKRLEKELSSE